MKLVKTQFLIFLTRTMVGFQVCENCRNTGYLHKGGCSRDYCQYCEDEAPCSCEVYIYQQSKSFVSSVVDAINKFSNNTGDCDDENYYIRRSEEFEDNKQLQVKILHKNGIAYHNFQENQVEYRDADYRNIGRYYKVTLDKLKYPGHKDFVHKVLKSVDCKIGVSAPSVYFTEPLPGEIPKSYLSVYIAIKLEREYNLEIFVPAVRDHR